MSVRAVLHHSAHNSLASLVMAVIGTPDLMVKRCAGFQGKVTGNRRTMLQRKGYGQHTPSSYSASISSPL